jgi:transcriptional regulator with XRE-family HTH domain
MARQGGGSKKHRDTPDPLAELVGARIRQLREEADMSFDAFVESAGIGRGTASELERGLIVPSLGTLHKVAEALDVLLADLLLVEGSPRERLMEITRGMTDREVASLLRRLREEQR